MDVPDNNFGELALAAWPAMLLDADNDGVFDAARAAYAGHYPPPAPTMNNSVNLTTSTAGVWLLLVHQLRPGTYALAESSRVDT